MRVLSICERLGTEAGANLSILLPAALLHDLVNLPKNHPDRAEASRLAALKAEGLLKDGGYGLPEIEKIQAVIREHSYSAGHLPSSVESAVLQDADRLDALGAIGIMRTVTCGSKMGASYYDLAEPFASTRELNDRKFTVDHFFAKLLKLSDRMNTEAARREARLRSDFMRSFLKQLAREIGAENVQQEVVW